MLPYEDLSEDELERRLRERARAIGEDRVFSVDREGGDWEAAIRYPDGAIDRSALNIDRKMALVHLMQALDQHQEDDRRWEQRQRGG